MRLKAWRAGREPIGWNIEITDGEPKLQGVSGRFGLLFQLFHTRSFGVDDYAASDAVP